MILIRYVGELSGFYPLINFQVNISIQYLLLQESFFTLVAIGQSSWISSYPCMRDLSCKQHWNMSTGSWCMLITDKQTDRLRWKYYPLPKRQAINIQLRGVRTPGSGVALRQMEIEMISKKKSYTLIFISLLYIIFSIIHIIKINEYTS